MSGSRHGAPEVDALVGVLEASEIHLTPERGDEILRAHSWCRIRMTGPDGLVLSIGVDDEYGDATAANQALLLHLVLATCECFEEADDAPAWALDAGLDVSEAGVRTLYDELGAVVPQVREVVGLEVKAISSWDFALNAGAAHTLRSR